LTRCKSSTTSEQAEGHRKAVSQGTIRCIGVYAARDDVKLLIKRWPFILSVLKLASLGLWLLLIWKLLLLEKSLRTSHSPPLDLPNEGIERNKVV